MYKGLIICCLTITQIAFAQIAIGKNSITNNSVSLEFGNISNTTIQKGIVVPYITNQEVVSQIGGTIVFDASDKKFKVFKEGDINAWEDLTITDTGIVDTTSQDKIKENVGAKVSIGKPTQTPGALVLEDDNKAMILPLVDNYKTIQHPSPGMIAYDVQNKLLCLFNGTDWSFWSAE